MNPSRPHESVDLLPPEGLPERTSILSACDLPGDAGGRLYPTITPVTSFRVVFDAGFGAEFALLPDRPYFSTVGSAPPIPPGAVSPVIPTPPRRKAPAFIAASPVQLREALKLSSLWKPGR